MKRWYKVFLVLFLVFQTGCGGGNGDRVLVAKYMYEDNLGKPNRHDVVVFRYPDEPLKNGVPTNYIKRLLGLAGETIAIFFGQLFYTTALDYPEDREKVNHLDLWITDPDNPGSEKDYMHTNDPRAEKLFKAGKFEIIRKPPSVMLSLRRIVYDNDFQASDLKGVLPPRWDPIKDSGWTTSDSKTFTFSRSGKEPSWLNYQHILRPNNWPDANDPNPKQTIDAIKQLEHKPELITDFLAYNSRTFSLQNPTFNDPIPHWVGDLMLEIEVKVDKAEGEMWLELARGVDRFHARWDLASGNCTLVRLNDEKKGKEEVLRTELTALKGPGTYQVRFANFDERLTVWVNQSLPFGDGVTYPRAWKWDGENQWLNAGPTVHDLKPASIGGKGAAFQVSHLKLWRDTYYTTALKNSRSDYKDGFPPDNWSNPDQGPLHQLKLRTMFVQPGHYLCLGDNSPESADSRSWGVVPERLMLGRALVVYYPFGRVGIIH